MHIFLLILCMLYGFSDSIFSRIRRILSSTHVVIRLGFGLKVRQCFDFISSYSWFYSSIIKPDNYFDKSLQNQGEIEMKLKKQNILSFIQSI